MTEERFYPRNNKKLAERLGVSFITLKRWIYQGKVKAVKTIGRRYRVPESEKLRMVGKKKKHLPRNNRAGIYARVSSYDQVKDGVPGRRLEHLRGYASKLGYQIVELTGEVGTGLNDRRPKLLRIRRMVAERNVEVVAIVEYRDRLTRFGFNNHLVEFGGSHEAEIETVFDDVKKKDPQELVEDMISVVQSFFFSAARLYGRGSHKYRKVLGGMKSAVHV